MSRPVFRQYCVTFPGTDKAPWYGIEEYRVKPWGTTCHPVMINHRQFMSTDTKWTDAEFQKQIDKTYIFRIADLRIAEQKRQERDAESWFEQVDKLVASALAEIDAMVKEAKA